MTIVLHNKAAQKVCESYLKRVSRMTQVLSKEGQQDILLEIESHIYESLQQHSLDNELDALLAILEKLGEPEEFLVEMVAERKMEEAARTANPLHLIHAFRLNISRGIAYVFMALLYLFTFCFTLLIPLKLIFPAQVGLFKEAGRFVSFGYLSKTEGTSEVLGGWFIPLVLGIVIILYFSIVVSLRLLTQRR
ncbi:MAG: hypothetical protein AAF135_15025 [Bacteroidota bacterium]